MKILVYASPSLPVEEFPSIEKLLGFSSEYVSGMGEKLEVIFSHETNKPIAAKLLQWCLMHRNNAIYYVGKPEVGDIPKKLLEEKPENCLVFTEKQEDVADMASAAQEGDVTTITFFMKDAEVYDERITEGKKSE